MLTQPTRMLTQPTRILTQPTRRSAGLQDCRGLGTGPSPRIQFALQTRYSGRATLVVRVSRQMRIGNLIGTSAAHPPRWFSGQCEFRETLDRSNAASNEQDCANFT